MNNELKIDELNELIEFHEESIERIDVYIPSENAKKLIKEIKEDIKDLKKLISDIKLSNFIYSNVEDDSEYDYEDDSTDSNFDDEIDEKKADGILDILIKEAIESKDPYISPSLVEDIHNAVKKEFPNSKSTLKNLESERKMEQEVKKVIEEYITKNDK